MLILKTIICGRHLEENYKVTAWCTLRRFESRPFCVCDRLPALGTGWWEGYWMRGGREGNRAKKAKKRSPAGMCVPCLLAGLRAGKKKMKFSSVLFLWQIQLLWGLVQSGVTSKRQKLKTWQLMKWQMTRKFRQGRPSAQTPGEKQQPSPTTLSRSHSLIHPPEERGDLLSPEFDSSWNNMVTATSFCGSLCHQHSTVHEAWNAICNQHAAFSQSGESRCI